MVPHIGFGKVCSTALPAYLIVIEIILIDTLDKGLRLINVASGERARYGEKNKVVSIGMQDTASHRVFLYVLIHTVNEKMIVRCLKINFVYLS